MSSSPLPSDGQPVDVSIIGDIATITLNRPQNGNAVDFALAIALARAADRCNADETVRCVILTGAGRLFCAGGDIGVMASAGAAAPTVLLELAHAFHDAIKRLVSLGKPLVVLVNGPAAGAGLSLALIGDVVVAGRAAQFRAGYGAIGLTPDGGLSWILPRLIGLRRAQEMILTNRGMGADDALAAGLVTRVVDDAELHHEGEKTAATLANSATAALARARGLLFAGSSSTFADHLDREAIAISTSSGHAEAREGIAAFLAKRTPIFRRT